MVPEEPAGNRVRTSGGGHQKTAVNQADLIQQVHDTITERTAARLALGLDRRRRIGERRASGVPWRDSLGTDALGRLEGDSGGDSQAGAPTAISLRELPRASGP